MKSPDPDLARVVRQGFAHYFEDFRQRVHALAAGLSNEQFWTKPHAYGNSFGNLVLHLTGNLNYYIGAQLEGTDYVRDREREFAEVNSGNKAAALAALDEAVSIVNSSLERQSEVDLVCNYSADGVDDVYDRFSIFLRCCVHFHHHIGQMIYLAKAWSQ